jgi:hypothetical protein
MVCMAMSEAEWLACSDPEPMLEFLRGKRSDRKLRLFAVACCRRIWDRLVEDGSRHAVQVAERFADGLATPRQLQMARKISEESKDPAPWGGERACAWSATHNSAWSAAEGAARTSQVAMSSDWDAAGRKADRTHDPADRERVGTVFRRERDLHRKAQAALLRCIFGLLPFRPATINATWQTSNVTALARSIYDDRAFDRLPILADALEDAGCDNADILQHCRSGGEHVRGCWIIDLVLGKE